MQIPGQGGQPSVVIVDDEDMVITSVRAFLSLETEYDINGFTDPEEASRFLETHPVDVVVSDYLMPKMNGIQLLSKAKQLQPEAARVEGARYRRRVFPVVVKDRDLNVRLARRSCGRRVPHLRLAYCPSGRRVPHAPHAKPRTYSAERARPRSRRYVAFGRVPAVAPPPLAGLRDDRASRPFRARSRRRTPNQTQC